MFCGSGGSKSRFTKEAGAKPSGQVRDEKLHAVVARSAFRYYYYYHYYYYHYHYHYYYYYLLTTTTTY